MMDPGVIELLHKHKGFFDVQDSGRLVCTLNKHSLPPSRQALEAFVNGKKYAQLRKKAEEAKSLSRYEPFLVPSKNFPDQLYCSLTCQVMQAKLETVKKHMTGKRFNAAKTEFENDERELMEEPDIETSEEADPDGAALIGEALPMEEDNLPEAESPTSLLDAIDTTGISVQHHVAAESAPVKVNVKAGQKRKQKDSNTNQLPRARGKPGKRKAM